MPSLPRFVVAFSGSDPTCGAGLQADVLAVSALGCHPLTVATVITAQDTHGVAGVRPVEADWVAAQARALLAEFRPAAFKLGALGSPENARAVAAILAQHPDVPVVVDPVLASGRGDALGAGGMAAALSGTVLPLATIATPNGPEARVLAGDGPQDLAACAQRLLARGCRHVLVTGGHESTDEVVNVLYGTEGMLREDRWPRLPGSFHGSGCTLAAAIAAYLARGTPLADAVREAQAYTWRALAAAFRPGTGQWIPDRLAAARESA